MKKILFAIPLIIIALVVFWPQKTRQTSPEINDNRALIKEYLFNCSRIEKTSERLECFETYYLNDPEIKSKKEKLPDDEYFFMMAEKDKDFCSGIKEKQLRERCLSDIK